MTNTFYDECAELLLQEMEGNRLAALLILFQIKHKMPGGMEEAEAIAVKIDIDWEDYLDKRNKVAKKILNKVRRKSGVA